MQKALTWKPKRDSRRLRLALSPPLLPLYSFAVCLCVCCRRMKQNTEILCVTLKSIPHRLLLLAADRQQQQQCQRRQKQQQQHRQTIKSAAAAAVVGGGLRLFVFVFVFRCRHQPTRRLPIFALVLLLPSAFSLLSAEHKLLLLLPLLLLPLLLRAFYRLGFFFCHTLTTQRVWIPLVVFLFLFKIFEKRKMCGKKYIWVHEI